MSLPVLSFDPDGLDPTVERALDQILAPLQVWVGRQEGLGRWIHVDIDNTYLSIEGTGNSFTLGDLSNQYSYTILGDTMILSWYLQSADLTIAVGVDSVFLLIPDGYQAVAEPSEFGRWHSSVAWFGNSGSSGTAFARTGYPTSRHIRISRLDGLQFSTDTGFLVAGQLAFEINPREGG